MNSTKQILLFTLFTFLFYPLTAQDGFLGKALGDGVNTEYEELVPRLSPDGQRLYFVRAHHPGNVSGRGGGQDIWVSKRNSEGTWQAATRLPRPLNDERHNFVGAVAENGNALVLGNGYESQQPGISISRRSGSLWGPPQDELAFSGGQFLSFHCTSDLSYLLLSLSTQTEKENLYVCMRVDGRWENPQPLGSVINTSGSETAPFISEDGKRIFFTSTGLPGHLGGGDIYMAERLDNSWENWSEPVHLGPSVNTAGYDGYFSLDERRQKAYFVSGSSPKALGDIYEIPLSDIPPLVPPAVVETLHVETKQGLPKELSFVRYGVPDDAALLVTSRSVDGPGELQRNGKPPHFLYQPAPGWAGTETLELTYCDPPQSDNCQRILVVAKVTESFERAELALRTPVETPLRLDLPPSLSQRLDLQRSAALNTKRNGQVKWNNETESEYLRYTPKDGFRGMDTLLLVGICDAPDPMDCIAARVIVDVFGEAVVVTEPDPVVTEPVVVDPVVEDPAPLETFLLFGRVTEAGRTLRPEEVNIQLFEEDSNRNLGKLDIDETDGSYKIRLPAGIPYRIEANSPFHYPIALGLPGTLPEVERNIDMRPLPLETGQVFTLNNVYFDLDKATLRPESTDELRRLYEFLMAHPTMQIEVRGHTDNQNTEAYNLALSEARVKSVVNYLKYRGIMGSRLQSKGYGESEPVATNETAEGRQKNRRVEFVILRQ